MLLTIIIRTNKIMGKYILIQEESIFTVKMAEHWKSFSRELVEYPSLEILGTVFDDVL